VAPVTAALGELAEDPYLATYLATAAVMLSARLAYLLVTREGKRPVRRLGDTVLLAATASFLLPVPLAYALTDLFALWDYHLPAPLRLAGLALIAAAGLLIWRAHADLGRNFAAAPGWRGDHALVTSGVYRRVRHPMYAGLLLWGAAMPLALPNYIVGVVPPVVFALFILHRVPLEERLLEEQFGDAYCRYQASTGRLVPRRRRG